MVCVNVGGLLLARIAQARRDAAMRRALGASRARIACQWTVESVLVAAIGGVVGLVLAAAAMPALVRWLSPLIGFGGFGRPPTLDVSFDLRIAAFGVAAILAHRHLGRARPYALVDEERHLRGAEGVDRRSRNRPDSIRAQRRSDRDDHGAAARRRASSSTRSTVSKAVDAGFDRELLVRFAIDPRLADYDGPAAAALQRRLLEETARLPGVQAAAITGTPVMQGMGMVMVVTPPGGPPDIDGAWNTSVNRVTAGYFATMGIELLSGAVFDDEQAPPKGPRPWSSMRRSRAASSATKTPSDVNSTGAGIQDAERTESSASSQDASYRSLREANPPIFYVNPLSFPPRFAGDFSLLVENDDPGGHHRPRSRAGAFDRPGAARDRCRDDVR